MSTIQRKYIEKCHARSDINEHLPTLYEYAKQCTHITEAGVRTVVSSYAFAMGLKNKKDNKLIQIDLKRTKNVDIFKTECDNEGINVIFYEDSDLTSPIEPTELFFIDTWHIYGHLKRELERWNSAVSKYIIMHDTTVDEWKGETIRCRLDPVAQSKATSIPVDEITRGLWPAIVEFLEKHKEWVIDRRYTNNNGLTILKRIE